MNGTEQRQRRTAVQAAERQIEDLQTVVMGLAAQMVKDREAAAYVAQQVNQNAAALSQIAAAAREANEHACLTCQERWDSASATHIRLDRRIHGFIARQTFLQRLRWLLTGK